MVTLLTLRPSNSEHPSLADLRKDIFDPSM